MNNLIPRITVCSQDRCGYRCSIHYPPPAYTGTCLPDGTCSRHAVKPNCNAGK